MNRLIPASCRSVAVAFFLLALLPRLPLVFLHNGQGDADNSVAVARAWLRTGHYDQRWPGSPLYDSVLAVLDTLATAAGIPYFYLSNLFSVLCVFATLWFLWRCFRLFLPAGAAFFAVAAFNFYPQELVIGASSYELNLLLALLAASFFAYFRGHVRGAAVLAILALGAKIMALALVVPLGGILLARDLRAHRPGRALGHLLLGAALLAAVFLPQLLQGDLRGFLRPFLTQSLYHQDLSAQTRHGAFLLRTGNCLGPIGLLLVLGALAWRWRLLLRVRGETRWLVGFYASFLLYLMFKAPWETYYLLPLVPLAFFAMFRLELPRYVLALFLVSAWLPNVIQVQLKPWRMPPWEIRDGVVKAHVERSWVVRGGG